MTISASAGPEKKGAERGVDLTHEGASREPKARDIERAEREREREMQKGREGCRSLCARRVGMAGRVAGLAPLWDIARLPCRTSSSIELSTLAHSSLKSVES